MKTDYLIVQTTTDTEQRARDLARTLMGEKLAACIEMHRVQSIYPWKGEVCETEEWVLVMKTQARLYDALAARIMALHTYELPQIIALPIMNGLPEYLAWVKAETTSV